MAGVRVTSEELASAVEVWLTVMPQHVWRDLEAYYEATKVKRGGNKPDARKTLAAHIVEHFRMAKWEITGPEPNHPYMSDGS